MDAHLPRPGGRGEELELPTGQETLTALRTGEVGGGGMGTYLGAFDVVRSSCYPGDLDEKDIRGNKSNEKN